MKYYIKERHNPQIGIYYSPQGQLSKAEAMWREQSLYGDNIMHAFPTEAEYKARIAELQAKGERVVPSLS